MLTWIAAVPGECFSSKKLFQLSSISSVFFSCFHVIFFALVQSRLKQESRVKDFCKPKENQRRNRQRFLQPVIEKQIPCYVPLVDKSNVKI